MKKLVQKIKDYFMFKELEKIFKQESKEVIYFQGESEV